jgi:hypothetical protein
MARTQKDSPPPQINTGKVINKPRNKDLHNLMTMLGNLYIDGDYEYNNVDFQEALRTHVKWVSVTDCGPSGTESLDTHYILQVSTKDFGSSFCFNLPFNPTELLMVKKSKFEDSGWGLFAASCFHKGDYITFYIGKKKHFSGEMKRKNPYLYLLRGYSPKTVLDPTQNKNTHLLLGAHYMNDKNFGVDLTEDHSKHGRTNYNAKFEGIFVKVIRFIRKGSEIIIDYRTEYN